MSKLQKLINNKKNLWSIRYTFQPYKIGNDEFRYEAVWLKEDKIWSWGIDKWNSQVKHWQTFKSNFTNTDFMSDKELDNYKKKMITELKQCFKWNSLRGLSFTILEAPSGVVVSDIEEWREELRREGAHAN